MKMIRLFLGVIAVLCSLNSAYAVQENTVQERIHVYDQWIAATKKVAGNNTDAQGILNFVQQNSRQVMPIHTAEGLSYIGMRPGDIVNKPLVVVCAMLDDRQVSPAWAQEMEEHFSVAWFSPVGMPRIVIRGDVAMSDTWKALVLLREGKRAYDHHRGAYESEDIAFNDATEEYFAYKLEFDLLKNIGGNAYTELVAKEMRRIIDARASARPAYGVYTKELNRIFGKAHSPEEQGMRDRSLWVKAHIEYIKRSVESEQVDDVAINFLKKIGEIGIL